MRYGENGRALGPAYAVGETKERPELDISGQSQKHNGEDSHQGS